MKGRRVDLEVVWRDLRTDVSFVVCVVRGGSLNVRHNSIDDEGLTALLQGARTNSALTALYTWVRGSLGTQELWA